MDKSLFIDTLSIDDNRNIKKLYSIMDLARQKQTIDSLIANVKMAYEKLEKYHQENRDEPKQWVPKNIMKDVQRSTVNLNPVTEPIEKPNP